MKKLYWVTTTSSHQMSYAVETEAPLNQDELQKRITNGTVDEVGQKWDGEVINSVKEISPQEYQKLWEECFEVNSPYREWTPKERANQITNLDEEVTLKDEA